MHADWSCRVDHADHKPLVIKNGRADASGVAIEIDSKAQADFDRLILDAERITSDHRSSGEMPSAAESTFLWVMDRKDGTRHRSRRRKRERVTRGQRRVPGRPRANECIPV